MIDPFKKCTISRVSKNRMVTIYSKDILGTTVSTAHGSVQNQPYNLLHEAHTSESLLGVRAKRAKAKLRVFGPRRVLVFSWKM